MTDKTNSKMLAPAEIYKVLKGAHDNRRLEDNLAQIAREIARLDPAYVAYCAAVKDGSPEASMVLEEPATATSGVQIRKLEWVLDNEKWRCKTHLDYDIECWWETDTAKTPRDPEDPHYFVINDDDNERYDTIEEAMEAAQTLYEEAANSYLVTPIDAPSDEKAFKDGREQGLREGAKIAADFVWKAYKNDGIVTSHDYEKVSEAILEQIDHPAHEEELNVSIAPR